ncbi:MAG: DUF1788 domain-containing protein [Pyrinomonadaceae bacterium]
MNRIDQLLDNYRTHIQMPLRSGLPRSQRVWFAVYPPEDERRISLRMGEFELSTTQANLSWVRIDLQGSLTRWLSTVDEAERDDWFRNPDDVELYAKTEWKDELARFFNEQVDSAADAGGTVFALTGLIDLYDLLHVSELIEVLEEHLKGYLLVFFPGEKEGNSYNFLAARKGWNYLAVPILCEK